MLEKNDEKSRCSKHPSCISVIYDGKRWNSINELCRSGNYASSTVRDKIKLYGRDLDAAGVTLHDKDAVKNGYNCVNILSQKKANISVIRYCGKDWNIKKLSKEYGISVKWLTDKARLVGTDFDRVGCRIPVTRKKPIYYANERFLSCQDVARCYGLKEESVWRAIEQYGRDLDASDFNFTMDDFAPDAPDWMKELGPRLKLNDL